MHQNEICTPLNQHLKAMNSSVQLLDTADAIRCVTEAAQPEIERLGTTSTFFSSGAKGLQIQQALNQFKSDPSKDNLIALTGSSGLNRSRIFWTEETTAYKNFKASLQKSAEHR